MQDYQQQIRNPNNNNFINTPQQQHFQPHLQQHSKSSQHNPEYQKQKQLLNLLETQNIESNQQGIQQQYKNLHENNVAAVQRQESQQRRSYNSQRQNQSQQDNGNNVQYQQNLNEKDDAQYHNNNNNNNNNHVTTHSHDPMRYTNNYKVFKVDRSLSPQHQIQQSQENHQPLRSFDIKPVHVNSQQNIHNSRNDDKLQQNQLQRQESLGYNNKSTKQQSKLFCWGSIYELNTDRQKQSELSNSNSTKKQNRRNSNSRSRSKSKQLSYDDNQHELLKHICDDNDDNQNQNMQRVKYLHKFKKTAIVNVSCGKNHIGIISKKGELYMMGLNDQGQLGIESVSGEQLNAYDEPIQLSSLYYKGLIIDQVACGFSHTLAVSKNGKVFSWGYGKFGALGHQSFESINIPQEISFFTSAYQNSSEILQIQSGAHHSGLLDIHGDLYMWGASEVGQLGTSSRINECKPVLIRNATEKDERIKEISLGYYHTLILTDYGRILQTGTCLKILKSSNNQNQSYNTTFSEVKCILGQQGIKAIKAKEVSVALNEYGKMLIWSDTFHFDSIGGGIDDMARISFGEQAQFNQMHIHDFELCAEFILIRSNSEFFTYNFENKLLSRFNENFSDSQEQLKLNKLSILTCGHNYIIGIKTRMRSNSLQKLHTDRNKSQSTNHKKSHQKSSQKSSRNQLKYAQSQQRFDLQDLKHQQKLLDQQIQSSRIMLSEQDNIENDNNSQSEIISDTQIIHNQSLNGGRASTHIRKLSSSNRHTRSGSRGDQQLSNFSHDNSSFNNLTVLNSNSKLNKKISLNSNTNCNFDKQSVQTFNQRDKFGILNQNQIRSVIYDVMMDDNSLEATSRKSKNKSSGSRSRQQKFNVNQSYQDYNKSMNQQDKSICKNQSQQKKEQLHQESLAGQSNIPKSVRLSYDEIGGCHPISSSEISPKNMQPLRHKISKQQVLSHIDQNKTLDISRISQQNPQNTKANAIIDDNKYQKKGALSERRHGNKDKYKEALNREVQYRMNIEQQMQSLQQEFDCFKNDVGVDQMKQVLQESQIEYQKLYDLCVQECEKSNKMHELYKKEKHLREQRENQIIDLGDQEEMLKNQIRHLEDQLNLLRDSQDTEQQSLKQTVLDQQKIIEELREVLQNEKDNCKERVFDLEEMNISLRNELQQISDKYNGSMMIEQQSTQILKNQNLDLQSQLTLLKDRINILEKQNQTLEQVFNKERQNLQNEIITLQNKLQQKQSSLIEYDQILSQMREKEGELVKTIDQLQNVNVQNNYLTQGSNYHINDQSQIQHQIVNQDTSNSQYQKFQKPARNQSQNKSTNYIVKKNLGSQTQRVLEQKPITTNQQNIPQTYQQNQKPQQQQVNQSLNTSVNQIKKSQIILNKSTTPLQEKQTHSKSQSQLRTSQQSASGARSKNTQSPGRVQRVINLTELNPKCLLNDLQNVQSHREQNTTQSQQVADPQIINQDNSINNIVTSRNTFDSNKQTINKQQYIQASQTQTQMRKSSRSSSPIDYLGLKPKIQNNSVFMPRLGSQTSRNKPQQNFMIQQSQTYQQQTSSNNALAVNQHQVQLQQQVLEQQIIPSPKIIGRYNLENEQEDMGTPSQYSLNITPVVQSSRGQKAEDLQLMQQNQSNGQQQMLQNINNNNNMNSTMMSASNIQLNQSMFYQDEQIQNGFISGSSSTKGTSNLSKSFDGGFQMRSASNTGLRKQVKFLLNDQKQSLNQQHQQQKSNKDLPMQKQPTQNHQHQNSNLNKDLSPLLTNRQDQKGGNGIGMNREKEIEQLYQSLNNEMKQLKTLNNQAALQQPILSQQKQTVQSNSHINLPKTSNKQQSNHIVNYSFSQPQQNHEDNSSNNNIQKQSSQNPINESKMNISSCTSASISQNPNADNLKNKLEQIRKNKSILEDKIKEYEKKLSK